MEASHGIDHMKVSLIQDNIQIGSLLGAGAFAKVWHARDRRNGVEYALKIIDKRSIRACGRIQSVVHEKNVLSSLRHPGIVRLFFTFQDVAFLYFGLELVSGGELASLIEQMSSLSFSVAQFYAAEILVILEYLKSARIVHRDIKPTNLLVSSGGHIKLIDFDAAILVPESCSLDSFAVVRSTLTDLLSLRCFSWLCRKDSLCLELAGTTLYSPPEALLGTIKASTVFALDLWALGCVIYEMMAGKPAFHAENENRIIQRILDVDLVYPKHFCDVTARGLIEQLLSPDPRCRLGDENGFQKMKSHSFFGGSLDEFDRLLSMPPSLNDDDDFFNEVDVCMGREVTPVLGESFESTGAVPIMVKTFSTCA
eukprot:TRINITY_DN46721_c0_g1_i1.p1 TRINITY_DN46721_c0_g1~~TRINITY_DN46721_c0_g1_i1.p1  ORF type:complete len:368 (+),score=44.96 TRINITY_DN46721_c0_g1_i1:68-1171(+)